MCRGEAANRKFEEVEGTELNGAEEGEDGMSDAEGDGIDGEEELAPPGWRVKAGPGNKPTQNEREEHEATHVPFRDCCTLHDGQRTHPSPRHPTKGWGSVENTHHCDGEKLHGNEVCCECLVIVRSR